MHPKGRACVIMNQTKWYDFLPGIALKPCIKEGFSLWLAKSVNIPVLPALSHFTFLVHVRLHIFPVTAGNRTLPVFEWQPWGFSWQGPGSVTGANPVTGLFKFVFGVTEISTTWTPSPPIFQLCPCVSQFQEEECTLWPCPLGLGGKYLLSFGIWKALMEWIWE